MRIFKIKYNKKYKHLFIGIIKNYICFYFSKNFGWIRVLKYYIYWKNLHTHAMLFDERHGYTKKIILFNWMIGFKIDNFYKKNIIFDY